jgi:hypothetical protein
VGKANLLHTILKQAIVVTLITLGACASVAPAPSQALLAAESAIDNADQERVSDYDLPELGQARDKLTAARAAVQKEDMPLAKSLADESRVSAELALARARQMKAAQVNDEMLESIETLKQEMQRNTGDPQ